VLERPGRELISLQPEAAQEEEGWLLSYLDVLTLLLTLFVLLLALSGFDLEQESSVQAAAPDSSTLGLDAPEPVFAESPAAPVLAEAAQEEQVPADEGLLPDGEGLLPGGEGLLPGRKGLLPGGEGLLPQQENLLPQEEGLATLEGLDLEGVSVESVPEGVALRIEERLLFSSGRATLRADSRDVLARLASALAGLDAPISVEGHSDGRPIANDSFPSNWELSAARAASVLRGLISEGLPAARLRAVGYADTRPIGDNATSAGRQANRRVELVVSIPGR